MTPLELRTLLRANGFPNSQVLHAKADDGREYGDQLYDLPDGPALDMRLAAIQGSLRARNWTEAPNTQQTRGSATNLGKGV